MTSFVRQVVKHRDRPARSGLESAIVILSFPNKCLLSKDYDVIAEFLCIVQNTDTTIAYDGLYALLVFLFTFFCFFVRHLCPWNYTDNDMTDLLDRLPLAYQRTS